MFSNIKTNKNWHKHTYILTFFHRRNGTFSHGIYFWNLSNTHWNGPILGIPTHGIPVQINQTSSSWRSRTLLLSPESGHSQLAMLSWGLNLGVPYFKGTLSTILNVPVVNMLVSAVKHTNICFKFISKREKFQYSHGINLSEFLIYCVNCRCRLSICPLCSLVAGYVLGQMP